MEDFILGIGKFKKKKNRASVKSEGHLYICIEPFNCVIIINKNRKIFSRLETEYVP